MRLLVRAPTIVKDIPKRALGVRYQIRMKWVLSALREGSATDVAGRSRLSKTGQVTDGDSLSLAFPEQDVQRIFSEEEAILLEAQLE